MELLTFDEFMARNGWRRHDDHTFSTRYFGYEWKEPGQDGFAYYELQALPPRARWWPILICAASRARRYAGQVEADSPESFYFKERIPGDRVLWGW